MREILKCVNARVLELGSKVHGSGVQGSGFKVQGSLAPLHLHLDHHRERLHPPHSGGPTEPKKVSPSL